VTEFSAEVTTKFPNYFYQALNYMHFC